MRVEPISKAIADQFVLAKHYSRRAPIFWAGFGLIEGGMVTGVDGLREIAGRQVLFSPRNKKPA